MHSGCRPAIIVLSGYEYPGSEPYPTPRIYNSWAENYKNGSRLYIIIKTFLYGLELRMTFSPSAESPRVLFSPADLRARRHIKQKNGFPRESSGVQSCFVRPFSNPFTLPSRDHNITVVAAGKRVWEQETCFSYKLN